MDTDLVDLYGQASRWTAQKMAGVDDLDAATPCTDWRVRDLLNHMLDTQRYFAGAARGEDASPPDPTPPSLLTDDPSADGVRFGVSASGGGDRVEPRTGRSRDR
jgi:hypothetical protein